MKLRFIIFLISSVVFFSTKVHAQVTINVNINSLPEWAPKRYIPETRYYFIPEIGIYYDIPARMYIYPNKKGWARNRNLPKHYAKYNLNSYYKVSLYDIGPNPYIHYNEHKKRYSNNLNKKPNHSNYRAQKNKQYFNHNYRNNNKNKDKNFKQNIYHRPHYK